MNDAPRGRYLLSQGVINMSQCPHCGAPCDAYTGAHVSYDPARKPETAVPEPGTPTVCAKCGEFCVFADYKGTLRKPLAPEIAAWQADPKGWALMQNIQGWVKERRRQR